MPFCPNCQIEYDLEHRVCTKCGADLLDALETGGLELVELARFPDVAEAEMIKELLEKNEIHTALRGEVDPIGVASRAEQTTLLVEQRDRARSRDL
jgi:hypothetical protein